eukprot:13239999-Alexandrium_andersonii.AAC.1
MEMACYLHATDQLSLAEASWRTSLLQPGNIVEWADLQGLWMVMNKPSLRALLWPVEVFEVGGHSFFGLQKLADA